MYENMTYEKIKQNILDEITTDINKSEGTIINDIVSPISLEMGKAYTEFEKILSLMFLDGMEGSYIDRKVSDYGIYRKAGTKAYCIVTFTGSNNTVIPFGALVQAGGGLLFQTVEEVTILNTSADVKVEALEIGSNYNVDADTINNIPISINGVISVTNSIGAVGGTDTETDESLLNRYLQQLQNPSTSGNTYNYKQWALEVQGVGGAKIFPLWNGPGTVKTVIVDSNKQPATEILVNETADHIEKMRPIGAEVTVKSASGINIDVSGTVTLASGYTLQKVIDIFKNEIAEYFKSIAFESNYVSYARIGTVLLSVDGVLDYSNLKLNGTYTNIELNDEEIPVLGTVSLEV